MFPEPHQLDSVGHQSKSNRRPLRGPINVASMHFRPVAAILPASGQSLLQLLDVGRRNQLLSTDLEPHHLCITAALPSSKYPARTASTSPGTVDVVQLQISSFLQLGHIHGVADGMLLPRLEENESCSGLNISQLLNHLRKLLNLPVIPFAQHPSARGFLLLTVLPLP